MGRPTYLWRKLTPKQRDHLLTWRRLQGLPWHRPPHRASEKTRYHVTAACFEHRPIVGHSAERIESFCSTVLEVLQQHGTQIHAWCVLPNHYHALIETLEILGVLADLGRMHGCLSFQWNREEQTQGRQVWCGAVERFMRNESHFWATMNYVHHNPVHHGYVEHWQDWPFSSAHDYLAGMGRDNAARIWRDYPVLDYMKGWDDREM
jgi:putative transposase